MRGLACEQPFDLPGVTGLVDVDPRPFAVLHELLASPPLATWRHANEQLLSLLVVACGESLQTRRPIWACDPAAGKEVVAVAAGVDRQLALTIAVPRRDS